LWSDVHKVSSVTQVDGRIEAKAAGNGNGGQVETSGHILQVGEQLKLSAQATGSGTAGQWLLDPSDITISSGTNSGQAYSGGDFAPTSGASTSVLNTATLQSVLDTATLTVTVSTTNMGTSGTGTGNITIGSTLTWTSASKLILLATGGLTGSANIVTGGASSNLTINQAGNSSYSGVISGSGSVTKLGAGALTLSGTNTYTGGTTVSAGTLALGASNVLPSTGALTVSGGTLSLGAFNNSVGAVSIGTSGGSITSTTGVLTGNGYTFNNTSAATVSAILAGTGSLTQSGSGTTTLSGANTYTGGTNFNSGKLVGGSSGAFGSSGTLSFGGGTLGYGYATDFSARFSTVANQVYRVDTGSLTPTWATSLTGTGASLIKSGTGVLILNASNSLSGGITVQQGTLFLGNAAGLGTGGVVVNTGAAIDLNGKTVTSANPLSLSGTGTGTSGALLNTSSTAASFNGLISLAGNT
ncbi:MAG: hypothetical protein EBT05_18715, partial [Betaproteobacteria bacterium]|nr:hypothetical protein [Betaproteobacteria bacterium]